MLYFDNAATTWPKPTEVKNAVSAALAYYGANPGRSGHQMAMETAARVFDCRECVAELFGCTEPENVVFTKNCTEALNIAIKSAVFEGHCIISDLEHNSVLRPLYEMKRNGTADFTVAKTDIFDDDKTVREFDAEFRPNTKAVVVTGASNVFGIKPPVLKIAKLAYEHGAVLILDAAQTAGAENYNMEKDGIDILCAPGHKGLLGPMGTGILATRRPELMKPLLFGGTGSFSLDPAQPTDMPERLESGTINVPGICGLFSGIERVKKEGETAIAKREAHFAKIVYDELSSIKGVTLFTPFFDEKRFAPVISFVLGNLTGEETAALLSKKSVATRGGFHCAALAHKKMGTENRGTCRISIGPMNTFDEVMKLIKIIYSEAKNIC